MICITTEKQYHYKCIGGCGAEIDLDRFHPYGWICGKCRKTTKLVVKCADCGKDVEVSWSTYRNKKLDYKYRCETCYKAHMAQLAIDKFAKMDEEQRKDYMKPCHDGRYDWEDSLTQEEKDERDQFLLTISENYYTNETEEEKESRIKNQKKRFEDMTEEERKEYMKPAMEGKLNWRNNMSLEDLLLESERNRLIALASWEGLDEEERALRLQPLRDGWKIWNDNLSDNDRLLHNEKISKSNKETWNNMTIEDQLKRLQPLWDGWHNWWNSLSEEERNSKIDFLLNISKNYYANETDDQRRNRILNQSSGELNYYKNETEEHRQQRIDSKIQYWENLSYDKFIEIRYNRALKYNMKSNEEKMKYITKTEMEFMNILNKENIEYKFHYYNTFKDSSFRKLFPMHPISKSVLVSPYHEWDFLIPNKFKNVFIDVDGSYHDFNNLGPRMNNDMKNLFVQNQEFEDSQRKYQTDNLPAYIILAYDDKITDDTEVLNLHDHSRMSFQKFIVLLKKLSMYKK